MDGLWIPSVVLLAAFILDLAVGDPRWGGHPVRFMGRLGSFLAHILHRPGRLGLATGTLLVAIELIVVVAAYLTLRRPLVASMPWAALALDVVMLYFSIAFRDLFDHLRPVVDGLERSDTAAAQMAVQQIVGRDATLLDDGGIARAGIESGAESLSDGAVGPLTWFLIGAGAGWSFGLDPHSASAVGTAAALAFRTSNTLDSMFGHRSERYLYFGRAAARLDDVLCFLPARFAVLCLFVASFLPGIGGGSDGWAGLRIRRRDAALHPSPNAGQGESFVAGALDLRLGGPTVYAYGESERPWLGDGRPDATAADLRRASRLVFGAGIVAALLVAAILCAPFLASVSGI